MPLFSSPLVPVGALLAALAYAAHQVAITPLHEAVHTDLFVFCLLLAITVATALVLDRGREVLRRPALLTPLGYYLGASSLIELANSSLPWLREGPSLTAVGVSLSLSLALSVVVMTWFFSWQTVTILRHVDAPDFGGSPSSRESHPDVISSLTRTFGVIAIGYSVTIAIMLLVLSLAGSQAMIFVAMSLIIIAAFAWNGWTATLLLRVVGGRDRFWRATGDALQTAWSQRRIWVLPTTVQLLVLGVVTYLSFGREANTHVNFVWVGAFEGDSQWFDDYRDNVGTYNPAAAALLVLAGLYLAVVVKVRIARGLAAAHENAQVAG